MDKKPEKQIALKIVNWDELEINTKSSPLEPGQVRRRRGHDYVRDDATGEMMTMEEQELIRVAGAENACRADGLYRRLRRITAIMGREYRGWLIRKNGEVLDAAWLAKITWYPVEHILQDIGFLLEAGWLELDVCDVAVKRGAKVFFSGTGGNFGGKELQLPVSEIPEIPEIPNIQNIQNVPNIQNIQKVPSLINETNKGTKSLITKGNYGVGDGVEIEEKKTGGLKIASSEGTGTETGITEKETAGTCDFQGRKATISGASRVNAENADCESREGRDFFEDWSAWWIENVRLDKIKVDKEAARAKKPKSIRERIYLPERANPRDMLIELPDDGHEARVELEKRMLTWCHTMIGDLLVASENARAADVVQADQNVKDLRDYFYFAWESNKLDGMVKAIKLLQTKHAERNHLDKRKRPKSLIAVWKAAMKSDLGLPAPL